MTAITRIAIASLFVLLMASLIQAGEEGSRKKSFNVGKGGKIEVSTNIGDIRISTWRKNEVNVTVEGLDDEEFNRIKMTQSDNIIRVSYRSRSYHGLGHIWFDIHVPAEFNLDMNTSGGDLVVKGGLTGRIDGSTSGGDIKLENVFGGPIEVKTSGGDISTGNIEGDGKLKTAGGDIHVGAVNGSLTINTSGGDIRVEKVIKSLEAKTAGGDVDIGDVGEEARVSTSGGDIRVGRVSGRATLRTAGGDIKLKGASGNVEAHTSGGDIKLQDITGSIQAKTAGGDVEAELIPSGKGGSKLSTAGGDIRLFVDEKSKATIEATIRLEGWGWKKNRYIVKSEFPKESYETDEDDGEIHAVYKLNGGGELIELSTVNSNIEIYKLR